MTKPSKIEPPGSARLFSDINSPQAAAGVYVANIDGASRGNPGPASYAVVIRDPDGKIVLELGKRIGRTTNNVAEYYALLAALDYAANENISALRIQSDSELLVRQMQGRYKVKSPELKPLHERAAKISRQIHYFKIEHVRRELNRDADALANVALDSGDASSALPTPEKANFEHRAEPAAPAVRTTTMGGDSQTAGMAHKRRIRARFVRGVLVPREPLDLAEGTEVIAEIRNASEV